MLEQLISAAVMILSLLAGAAAVFARSTGTKTWAAAAYCSSFVYAALNFLAPWSGDNTVLHVTALSMISLAVAGLSFVFAVTEVSGVLVPKPFKFAAAGVTVIFVLFMMTMHIHGMAINSAVYYIMVGLMAVLTAAVPVYALSAMSRKLVKESPAVKAIAAIALLLVICEAIGGFVPGLGILTAIAVLASDIVLLFMLKKLDIADILEFGKSCGIDSTNDGVIILDSKKNYLFANRTAKSVFLELSESDRGKLSEFVSTVTDSDSIKRGDRVFSLKKTSYTDYRGSCDCIIVMIRDVTEQELRNTRLTEEAAIDSITGLYNRTKLIDLLTEACNSESGTLLNISFDGFKSINNLYGHEEANKLISTFGTLLKNNTNSDDIKGKLGGEIFSVFLRNCTSEGVIAHLTMRLEEQITDAMKKQLGDTSSISVGVSIGAVTVPDNGRDYETLAAFADEELDKIKESGGHGYSLRSGGSKSGYSESDFVELTPDSASDGEKPAESPAKPAEPIEELNEIEIEYLDRKPAESTAAAEESISLDELIIETPANNDTDTTSEE